MFIRDKGKHSEYCREWKRRRRRLHKEIGLCGRCNGKAIDGLTLCVKCWENKKLWDAEYRQRNKEKLRIGSQERRAKRKQENLCTVCGVPLRDDESINCVNCKIHSRFANRRYAEVVAP